ncbi:single-stranded DNA-binding protein [Streptococcus anginosus]|uniref:single-stranded DNA-binding protein n=1 Tax=Streptococcus anginosus TaxID=1328 RepID=UPI0021F90FF0|nr:single-stranded DNA-binding protein [Streptococcus anginosus]MCW0924617.1 single-stranded DNA-binding protein [Streptococcus anginosus]MED5805781.1 single-stranded DNA-binding protein [Streptococcus anginosus]MED5825267.1 single-stranded DNA-binding protein [Streptococcus anginosus]MED5853085.1 single-stranded DNA-binding protein [Streptococcus anginosus]MED5896257.1 single-stranded DNA-binding protein [Streptococcus anginosus]
MINNVVLVGRMTRDAELRYTQSNQAVATFTLAVNRNFKNQNGERETDFINCVIWRQQAENLANWAKKGALIGITGVIQTRNYENQQGQRVYVTEVIANSFQLLESRNSQNQSGNFQTGNSSNYGNTNSMPNFSREAEQTSFFRGNTTNPMDISDDDLPF